MLDALDFLCRSNCDLLRALISSFTSFVGSSPGAAGSQKCNINDYPEWMSASAWQNISYMETTFPEFEDFKENLNTMALDWKRWWVWNSIKFE